MDGEIARTIGGLVESLIDLASRDDVARSKLRAVAEAILAATARDEAADVETALDEATANSPPIEPEPEPVREYGPLPPLTLGQAPPPEPLPRPKAVEPRLETSAAELAAVEVRCRLKAEGMRWAMVRHRKIGEGDDFRDEIAPTDREILDRARDLECFLWMNSPEFVPPADPDLAESVALAFEATADASALARGMLPIAEPTRKTFERSLDLLAEAQSALRVALDRIGYLRDSDQYAAYKWLLGVAAREQIYIPKYMRLDDPGNPAKLADLQERVKALVAKFQEARKQGKKGKSHVGRISYHAKLILQGTGGEHDWNVIGETLDNLIAAGLPPSNVEVREAMMPVLDFLPDHDDRSPGLRLVVREIDRYLASRAEAEDREEVPDIPTAEVSEAARLLEGRSLALIGGIPHQDAREALRVAFRLADVVWVETREHESIERFEPIVARPDVAAVILAIRWSSHSFGEVKRFCDRYGKPMVRLPGGYNPNQVAAQLIAQVSGQLEVG